ncbi:2'-5' RNA ligase family protein [Micromonospora sp. KC207]|uniref:2'-5' RNA ligase family protein n=1 Tax=Micromonospora sp. KC207 TaxID=2530377 RepID=UPI0010520E66|nr:2'-5' RNA ligase family protein [Micromonospora sp. KC207]TDC66076.1 2'-5' RNA ligase family protein [Micromonospora sp. KC207]
MTTPSSESREGRERYDYVEEDWARYRTLDYLVNHWERPGWRPGRRSYHWMMCLGESEALRALATRCQAALGHIPTLDLVPLNWLHLTVQKVGFADEVSAAQLDQIVAAAQRRLAVIPPISLEVGPLAGSAGAVRFSAGPHPPVRSVRQALRQALAEVRGDRAVPTRATAFVPHVSIAYNNAPTDAAPVIDAVASLRRVASVTTVVHGVELVELRREPRSYAWDVLATGTLGNDEQPAGS